MKKDKMNKIFCVISHTHWDREWYMPFEKFRMRLVSLIDNLLDVLSGNQGYIFHLDAQTIVIEDYLAIRLGKKTALQKYIKKGRLLVGPWYVQNDFFLTSGEATIRNLLIGSGIAEEAGKCTWVGYAPDQFGLISQLPQILNGFGMDSCIFGRGYKKIENTNNELKTLNLPTEFIWKGEDGSNVLGINMAYWYNNAQRFSEDIDKSLKLLDKIEKNFTSLAITPYLLLMNGVDHLEAQENLLPILEELNIKLPNDKKVQQLSMPEYIKLVKAHIKSYVPESAVTSHTGELRMGKNYDILQGTLSSRAYLKTLNTYSQNMLESRLEPLYSFICLLEAGFEYPLDYLNYLWKLLMENHAHDSICGCSRDEVHEHMEDRFKRLSEVTSELLVKGMDFIGSHIPRTGIGKKDYIITVFNPVQNPRSAVTEIEIEFLESEDINSFKILDENNNEIDFEILSCKKNFKNVFGPINLPGTLEVKAYRVQMYIEMIKGLSYRSFIVKPDTNSFDAKTNRRMDLSNGNILENEFLKVVIHNDGKIDIKSKLTGQVFKDVLTFEDREDCGDSYVYAESGSGMRITSRGVVPEVKRIISNSLSTKFALYFNLQLPECFDFGENRRSTKLIENRAAVELGLDRGSQYLDIAIKVENRSKDHRLRALIHTGILSNFSYSASPFDVIERDRREVLNSLRDGTQPNSGFVEINGVNGSMAIINNGMYEYEHLINENGVIAMTILRANQNICFDSLGDHWNVPGNQCIREIIQNIALLPHKMDYSHDELQIKVKEFQNPVISYCQPSDTKLFTGGRPAVQDSDIKEIFYRKDPYSGLELQRSASFVEVTGKGVVLSALKKAQKDGRLIIRLFNSLSSETNFSLRFFKAIQGAEYVDMKENKIKELHTDEDGIKEINLKPKQIVSLAITFKKMNDGREFIS